LIDMGVPAYLVASSIIAIMAQRLVRVVCQKCKQPFTPPEMVLQASGLSPAMIEAATFCKGTGCGNCGGGGFRGRVGLYELMLMSSRIREMAFNEAPSTQIRRTAVTEGMKTLYVDGLQKACRGITTLEEVMSIAKQTDED